MIETNESHHIKTNETNRESTARRGTTTVKVDNGDKLDELSAMAAASVRKREKWKWLLPSSTSSTPVTRLAPITDTTFEKACRLGGANEEDDIRSSSKSTSLRPPRWNIRLFTCLVAFAFVVQCVSALPPVIRIGTIQLDQRKKRTESN